MFRHISATTFAAIVFGIVAVVCIALVATESNEEETDPDDISHGLGNHIDWHTLEEGLSLAKEEKKPLMLIIHKTWCGACRSLVPKLRESKEMEKISSKFIMVNTQDNDEPVGDIYKPDGGYVPRIFFFHPEGSLLDVINDDGNPQYKYYYYDAESVVSSMTKVAKIFSGLNSGNKDENGNIEGNLAEESATSGSEKSEL